LTALEKVLESPVRRRFMREALLRWENEGQTVSPSDVAAALGLPLDRVSYHARVCVKSGAITLTTTKANRGGTKHFYRPSVLLLSVDWLVGALLGPAG
jgi:DNA-binding transcriptional ArsR family regulator